MFRDESAATERRAIRSNKGRMTNSDSKRPEKSAEPSVLSVLSGSSTNRVTNPPAKGATKMGSSTTLAVRSGLGVDRPGLYDPPPNSIASVPMTLAQSFEQEAMAYFFSRFVLPPSDLDAPKGYMEFLLPLYNEAKVESTLSATTAAIALAAFGNARGQESLLYEARKMYSSAIAKANAAISDPVQARSNQTLMSILLFGLFETIACIPETMSSWGRHTDGAIALARLRGKEMLNNPISFRLFCAVRNQMVISYTTKCRPIPLLHGKSSDWTSIPTGQSESAANRLWRLLIQVPGIRAEAKRVLKGPKNEQTAGQISDLLHKAMMLDSQIAGWSSTVPVPWIYTPVGRVEGDLENPENAEAYPGPIDGYCDIWVSTVWNNYRGCRIFVQAIALSCVKRLVPECKESIEYHRAAITLQQLVSGICASVPYNMGYRPSMQQDPNTVFRHDAKLPDCIFNSADSDNAAQALGGYFLLWPLWIAGSVYCVPEVQRRWLRGRLASIGKRYGINQATLLSRIDMHVMTKTPGQKEIKTISQYSDAPLSQYTTA
ncbi:hypothetical protein MMC12_002595 [Toensbergia leucococca]|nr:hypothetical protein [Toensbergia leucococca]